MQLSLLYRVGQKSGINFVYFKTSENNVTKHCRIIHEILADTWVFFRVSGVTEGRPVEEVVGIVIEAYTE